MKKFFVLVALLFCSNVFAGPEDHTPGAVYQTSDSSAPYYISQFVFDTLDISGDETELILDARYGNLRGAFKITEVLKYSEDKAIITAEKVVLDKWETGCGSGEHAVLVIQGKSWVGQAPDPSSLKMTLQYKYTNDTCHSRPQVKTFEYHLVR